jgi:methionyl-tRNA formyltransferase
MHKDISVVFLGSGPVAATSLLLLAANFTIEAVITKPRPEHHKGPVPVLDLCNSPQSPCRRIITVTNKAGLSEAVQREKFESKLGVVIDFGIIISQDVIDSFPLGIINSHFSLLPQWRGADPITFAVLSGQKFTGVSVMRITAGLDEGPIVGFGVYDLQGDETTPFLTERLIHLSDGLLRDLLPQYVERQKTIDQEEVAQMFGLPTEPSFSRKLTKSDGVLDFHKPADQLEREIRAFAGWPGSHTLIGGKDVVITAAHVIRDDTPGQPGAPGTIWRNGKQFGFYSGDPADKDGISILVVDRLKPAGKSEMDAQAFLAGYKLQ